MAVDFTAVTPIREASCASMSAVHRDDAPPSNALLQRSHSKVVGVPVDSVFTPHQAIAQQCDDECPVRRLAHRRMGSGWAR